MIRTARLVLRPLAPEDVEAFVAYRRHPDVHPWQSWEADYGVDEARRLVAEIAAVDPGTPGEWCQVAVQRIEDGELLGDVAFRIHAEDPARATVGYTVAPEHQGAGVATEAVGALLGWLAGRGVAVVEADTLPANAASRRVLERLGFAHVGELDDGSLLYERRLAEGG